MRYLWNRWERFISFCWWFCWGSLWCTYAHSNSWESTWVFHRSWGGSSGDSNGTVRSWHLVVFWSRSGRSHRKAGSSSSMQFARYRGKCNFRGTCNELDALFYISLCAPLKGPRSKCLSLLSTGAITNWWSQHTDPPRFVLNSTTSSHSFGDGLLGGSTNLHHWEFASMCCNCGPVYTFQCWRFVSLPPNWKTDSWG